MIKKNIKIVTIIGARPQFIKAFAVSREIIKYENVNVLVGSSKKKMFETFLTVQDTGFNQSNTELYGRGNAACLILEKLINY